MLYSSCTKTSTHTSKDSLKYSVVDSITQLAIPLPYLTYVNQEKQIAPTFYSNKDGLLKTYNPDFKGLFSQDSFLQNGNILNAIWLSKDSFCLLTNTSISIVNNKSVKDIAIGAIDPTYVGHYPDLHTVPMYAYRDHIFLHRLDINCESGQSMFCKDQSLIKAINSNTGTQKDLPIYYPKCYFEQSFPRSLRIATMVPIDSLLVFNFAMDDDIYCYNVLTDKITAIKCRSSYQENDIIGLQNPGVHEERSQAVMDFYLTTPRYSRLTYDPYNKKYYRVFTQGQKLLNNSNLFNSILDAKTFVMVLDSNLSILGEFEIDTKKYNYGIVPTIQGLAVPRRKLVNETYQYDVFKINM